MARRNILLAEKRQRKHAEERQTQELEQRKRELSALNQLFQQQLGQYIEGVELYRGLLARSQLPFVHAQIPDSKNNLESLTDRQREILKLMARGYSNANIAQKLALTERSVEEHINAVYQQLELSRDDLELSRVKAVLTYLQRLMSGGWETPSQQ